jgi:hypothetical protein
MRASSLLSERLVNVFRRIALPLVLVLVGLAALLSLHHTDRLSAKGELNERFVVQLRRSVGDIPPDGILYVAHAPSNLVTFNDTRLDALVELYYGPAEVRSVGAAELPEVESGPRPQDRLFQFQP